MIGRIGNDPRRFAFVSCYNSREFYVIDLDLREPVAVVHGFSGPFELVLDRWRERIYVADFRSSVIRIVDLSPISCGGGDDGTCDESTVGETRIIATLGVPRPPEELL
jgi:hypothetical protein